MTIKLATANNQLHPFHSIPVTDPGPRITESTVDRSDPGEATYDCTAEGQPRPTIRWVALNTETGQEEQLEDGLNILTLTSSLSETEEYSILSIDDGTVFQMITCVAESSEGEVRSSMFVDTSLPPGMQLNSLHTLL